MISDKSVVRMRIAHYFEFMRYNNFMLRQSIVGSSQLLINNVWSLFYRHNHAVVWGKCRLGVRIIIIIGSVITRVQLLVYSWS